MWILVSIILLLTSCTLAASTEEECTAASNNLFLGAINGDLALVQRSLDEGADPFETKFVDSDDKVGMETARSLALTKTPPMLSWNSNVFTDIVAAIDVRVDKINNQRQEDARISKANEFTLLLTTANASTVLFHSVEDSDGCNRSLAVHALEMDPLPDLHATNHEGRTAMDVAASRAGAVLLGIGKNSCQQIADLLETALEDLENQRIAEEELVASEQRRREEEEAFPAIKLLRETYADFIGIDDLLSQLIKIIKSEITGKKLNKNLCDEDGNFNEAWILSGAPGTGKTSIARLLGPVLHAAGILSTPKVGELQKFDFKGKYNGQTAPKIQQVFDDYAGGVLFIDEAYDYDNSDALEKRIMDAFMNQQVQPVSCENRKIFLFAGYPKGYGHGDMEEWIAFNPGMKGRIKQRLRISPLSPSALATITVQKLKKRGLVVNADPDEFHQVLKTMIRGATSVMQREKHGGRVAVRLADLIFELKAAVVVGRNNQTTKQLHVVAQHTVCKAVNDLSELKFSEPGNEVECLYVSEHSMLPASSELVRKSNKGSTKGSTKGSIGQKITTKNSAATRKKTAGGQHGGGGGGSVRAQQFVADQATSTLLGYAQSLFGWVATTLVTMPWLLQYVAWAGLMIFFGSSLGSVLYFAVKTIIFFTKIVLWLLRRLWHLLKNLWNFFAERCGCKSKKFENVDDDDMDAGSFIRARNIVRREKGSVAKAMQLLWNESPTEMCLHGGQIQTNLEMLRAVHLKGWDGGDGGGRDVQSAKKTNTKTKSNLETKMKD